MRTCEKCNIEKEDRAFIGLRTVCRNCWHYLTEDEKRIGILDANMTSRYLFNKRAWEKEKLLRYTTIP